MREIAVYLQALWRFGFTGSMPVHDGLLITLAAVRSHVPPVAVHREDYPSLR
jgi:hypothetical protein